MTPERWKEISSTAKDRFKVTNEGEEQIDEEGGINISFLEFESPMGKIRLEFVTKPVVTGKKTSYSKRIGSETQVEYQYSETETSSKLLTYKWDEDEGDWIEIESKLFS
jgi:hypothetical protein